jgi:DNA-binding SARP family transcriptional activator
VVEFGLLGPLLVRRETAEVPIAAARQRVVLAALLFKANQVVPLDELTEALWDEGPPATARATLRNYVKRLQQALGDGDRLRIITRADGYLICVADGELDLARFETLREQASQCARAGRWAEASAALHAAAGRGGSG